MSGAGTFSARFRGVHRDSFTALLHRIHKKILKNKKSNKQFHATQQAHDINAEHVLVSPNGIQ